MNLDRILSEIDLEISRLQQAKQLLSENSGVSGVIKRGPGRPPSSAAKPAVKKAAPVKASGKRRSMSAAGRARIAAAQKARWAKTKKAVAPVAKKKPGRPAKAASKKATPSTKKAESTTGLVS